MYERLQTTEIGLGRSGERSDLVFDFSGMERPDLQSICLILTARVLVGLEERSVWVHALPDAGWRRLGALGIERLFKLLPDGGGCVH